MDTQLTLKVCDILEEHNKTGVSVLRATVGKWTEQRALSVLIANARQMVELIENSGLVDCECPVDRKI